MALQWEPVWEDVILEEHGIRLKVKRDRETGLIVCPICGLGEKASYFFTLRDLVEHITMHARRDWRRERIVVVEEESEEQ